MSDSTASLRRKIGSAGDLQSVVRAMKAQAAASVGQYEKSVTALADYARTVELGLTACFRADGSSELGSPRPAPAARSKVRAVVFGSDQGLVGRFNDVVIDFALDALRRLPGKPQVWAVGDRVRARLADAGVALLGQFAVPASVQAITPLVGRILVGSEDRERPGNEQHEHAELHLFYNRPTSGSAYAPVGQRLLPLDRTWLDGLAARPWPTPMLAEVLGTGSATLRALIREYLFVSLFRACAESLASENASRLAAMDRADRNIDELLKKIQGSFHRLRQSSIDEELFDVIAGFDALSPDRPRRCDANHRMERGAADVYGAASRDAASLRGRTTMQVLLNTDPHIDGRQAMSDYLESVVTEALGHYGERITRVEAHISDANSAAKAGADDIHCTLEARPVGMGPVVVKERAATAHQAIHGAVRKLERALGSVFDKHDPRHASRPPEDA